MGVCLEEDVNNDFSFLATYTKNPFFKCVEERCKKNADLAK